MKQFFFTETEIALIIEGLKYGIGQVETSNGEINVFIEGIEATPEDQLKVADDVATIVETLEKVLKSAKTHEVHLIV